MDFYRGDARNFFSTTVNYKGFEPNLKTPKSGYSLYCDILQTHCHKTGRDVAYFIQATTRPGTVSTSMMAGGAYANRTCYVIRIPDNELTALKLKGALPGDQVSIESVTDVPDFYLIHTGPSLQASDLVAFVHKGWTNGGEREVTFLNAVPERYVAGTLVESATKGKQIFLPFAPKVTRDVAAAKAPPPPPPPRPSASNR